ncbi:MAG: polyprenyl synthetase family protein [Coprobacillaceae bacterium]
MEKIITEINQRLLEIIKEYKDSNVKQAMMYSLLAGGKRIRPLLFINAIRSYDKDYHPYLDIACAIEMIHTYSLIHDDLPGMDNDDLRRGMPTCHKRFDEATAILAGDSLLNEAMNVILRMKLESELKIEILSALFKASGLQGMIYGQQLDMKYEKEIANCKQLEEIHNYKTGELISVSLALGAIIVSKEDVNTWTQIGKDIGLAFQIQDDILDVTSNSEILGKNIGSDADSQKSTYVSLLGIEQSQKRVEELFTNAVSSLYSLRINHGLILGLVESLKKRVS